MHGLDACLFWGYLVGVTLLGVFLRTRARSDAEFFLAGRSMTWLPIGLSVMVTAFSAINFVAFPGEVCEFGLYVLVSLPVFVLVALPVTRVFMPFYHGMQLTSLYEYFERRFDVRVRVLASGLFIVWRVLWMGTMLHASAEILSAVSGLERATLILIAGGSVTLYASLGGMRAVMWTDVAQCVVVVGGIVAMLAGAVGGSAQGWGGVVDSALAAGRLKPFAPVDPAFWSWNPTLRISFWSGLVGTSVAFLLRYTADQVVVQRYFSARSLQAARKGFWLNVVVAMVTLAMLAVLGLLLYDFSVRHALPAGTRPVRIMALLLRSLPVGLEGLVAAGVLAATMSSMDSGLNSCCAAWMVDFHGRFFARDRESRAQAHPLWNVGLSVALGALSMVAAFYVPRLGTLFAIVNKAINGMGTPLLALAVLAMFGRGVTGGGVLWGTLAGTGFGVWLCLQVDTLALHYYAVVIFLVTVLLSYGASAVAQALGSRPTETQLRWRWRRGGALPAPSLR